MVYIKVIDCKTGEVVGAEALENPTWVRYDRVHRRDLRCTFEQAHGIVSEDMSETYSFRNGMRKPREAEIITVAEYDTILAHLPDLEDDDPEIPDGSDEEAKQPMSRAELTEAVEALEKANALLTGMLLENREEEMKASRTYGPGDLIVVNGTLYKTISRIASGAALTANTNVKQTTLAAEIAAAKS